MQKHKQLIFLSRNTDHFADKVHNSISFSVQPQQMEKKSQHLEIQKPDKLLELQTSDRASEQNTGHTALWMTSSNNGLEAEVVCHCN